MSQRHRGSFLPLVILFAACQTGAPARPTEHRVSGRGVVVGLDGTGADGREARQAILQFLREQSPTLTVDDIVDRSAAMVEVAATVPDDAAAGSVLVVHCTAIDSGVSLRGGTLLRCELREAGVVRVVASGSVITPAASPAGEIGVAPGSPSGMVQGGLLVR